MIAKPTSIKGRDCGRGEQATAPPMPIEHVSGDSQLDDANPAADFDIYAKARQAGSFCGTVERE